MYNRLNPIKSNENEGKMGVVNLHRKEGGHFEPELGGQYQRILQLYEEKNIVMKSKFQETDGQVFTEQTVQQFKHLVQPINYELLRFFLCDPDHADQIDGFAEHEKVLYFAMDDKEFPIKSKNSLQTMTITQDQFNEILLSFANWNGLTGELSIIKKSDFDGSKYPDQDDIGAFDELVAEYDLLCNKCKEDEMVVFEYVQADELDILQHLNAKMIEYAEENSEDEYLEDEEYQHLFSLRDIVMQNLE